MTFHCPALLYSDMELMIMLDMYENGFDPHNKEDVLSYWRSKLD